MPTLAGLPGVAWEPLRRGRLAVLVSARSELTGKGMVSLRELSGQTFLVNPRSIARAPPKASSSCATSSADLVVRQCRA